MSYSKLGNSCSSLTNALTSNQKFILPYAPVYCKCCSKMTLYPGREPNCCKDLNKIPLINVTKNTCKSCSGK
jgi:hypothetical protein